MATSILTDCSSIQGSTASSSSDMLTGTTAASSWCAIPTSTRIRIVRLLRPHTRRMLVTPTATPSYGFAVRGGKEFGTGFFVSNVEHNSEAEQKGLRIGDQILRINGYRIDDATHKEFCQLVASQDRMVLKVRSVGMMPTKEKENDYLSWSMVKAPSISSTPSECSYQSSITERSASNRHHNERVVNIVLNVAPRTKLGLGICKGPEWKPGIFVQFTKEKSVARESGLRPGDQILTVNSIDFSDVLFSEAVAVMKSSNKLDMTVHKSAGCDLFPGESSGYNSSASSVTGDQSPCWGDVKSKRLTAVREESTVAPPPPPPVAVQSTSSVSSSSTAKQSTIWKHSIYENDQPRARTKSNLEKCSKPPTTSQNSKTSAEINKTIIKLSESGTSINNTYVASTQQSPNSSSDTMRRNTNTKEKFNLNDNTLTKQNQHSIGGNKIPPPVPPPMNIPNPPPPSQALQNSSKCHESPIAGPIKLGGMAATMQRYATLSNYVAINDLSSPTDSLDSREPSSKNNQMSTIDNSSLSSAITEELKKRKAKRQPNSNYQPSSKNDVLNSSNNNNTNFLNSAKGGADNESTKTSKVMGGSLVGADDHHNALMNEFKQAHKRMFKNGFKENEQGENKDRQEALNRTSIMDDPTTYRAKGCRQAKSNAIDNSNKESARKEDTTDAKEIPKPPPMLIPSNNNLKTKSPTTQKSVYESHIDGRKTGSNGFLSGSDNNSEPILRNLNRNSMQSSASTPTVTTSPKSCNRQTLRLGTVSIGEYRHNNSRKEPEKFDFIASVGKRNDSIDTTLKNESLHSELHSTLSRSKLKKTNSSHLEHQRNCPMHQQLQSNNNNNSNDNNQQQNQNRTQQQQQQPQHHHHHHHRQQHSHNNNTPPHSSSSSTLYDYQNVNINEPTPSYSVAEMSRKLQKTTLNGSGGPLPSTSSSHTSSGILKNGNRNSSSNGSNHKSIEKSIKFG